MQLPTLETINKNKGDQTSRRDLNSGAAAYWLTRIDRIIRIRVEDAGMGVENEKNEEGEVNRNDEEKGDGRR